MPPGRQAAGELLSSQRQQLSALAQTHELFTRRGIDYWLFGGWAVDFHVGSVTRPHDDIDVAVWLDDHDRIARLLKVEDWKHAPEPDEDGGTGYERDAVRLELTFLVPGDGGEVYIPLRADRVLWSEEPLSTYFAELSGVRARVLGLAELKRGKSRARDDPGEAAKDRADFDALSHLAASQAECGLRIVEALELERLRDGFEPSLVEPLRDAPVRLLAEHDLARLRRALQACGEVRGGPENGDVAARNGSSDDCRADGDPDAHAEIEECGLSAQRERGLERFPRVVEPRSGCVERRHDRVARELVDEAVLSADFRGRPAMERADPFGKVSRDLEEEALRWLRARDEREYSFVDATSFAVMRSLRINEALAFDGDFAAAGFTELRA